MPRFFIMFTLAAITVVAGCMPSVVCRVDTIVYADFSCRRVAQLNAIANPQVPNQRVRLSDYFQPPPAENYDTFVIQPDKAVYAGRFPLYSDISPDLGRIVPGSTAVADNRFHFRALDFVLFVIADFEENLSDITTREDGSAALDELLRGLLPEVLTVLHARYDATYDISRLENWLQVELPGILQRVYGEAWAISRARRGGFTAPTEEQDIQSLLMREAKSLGLDLVPMDQPGAKQENLQRLKKFGSEQFQRLCIPRQPGQAMPQDMLSARTGEELLGAVQKAILARHGSFPAYMRKIESLMPRVFGAHLMSYAMPLNMTPEVKYQFRMRLPGTIIHTNGLRDFTNDLYWTYSDYELAFSGQTMWARTIVPRENVLRALGLKNFPGNLANVDIMFSLAFGPDGKLRESMFKALEQSALQGGLGPLEALARSADANSVAAGKLLELLRKHQQQAANQPNTPSTVEQPVPPEAPPPAKGPAPTSPSDGSTSAAPGNRPAVPQAVNAAPQQPVSVSAPVVSPTPANSAPTSMNSAPDQSSAGPLAQKTVAAPSAGGSSPAAVPESSLTVTVLPTLPAPPALPEPAPVRDAPSTDLTIQPLPELPALPPHNATPESGMVPKESLIQPLINPLQQGSAPAPQAHSTPAPAAVIRPGGLSPPSLPPPPSR